MRPFRLIIVDQGFSLFLQSQIDNMKLGHKLKYGDRLDPIKK